jgi:polar amino acid transport system substrate-binding protein
VPQFKILISCCFLLIAFPSVAEDITLVQDPWPPITSENIESEALATVIVSTALRNANYTPIVKTIPWKRALFEVETIKSDAIVAAYYNDERAQIYDYSAPYLITPVLFLKRRDTDIRFQSLKDLQDYRIGYVRGTSSGNEFDNADYLNKVELNNPSTVIRMLYNKRIDIAPFTSVVGTHLINTEFPEWRQDLEYFGPPIQTLHYYIIVGKKHPRGSEILARFNNEIAKMINAGTIRKIIEENNLQDAFPENGVKSRTEPVLEIPPEPAGDSS